MAIDSSKVTAFVNALKNKFEAKANKVTSWSSTTTDTNYPSEKLVKDSLDEKISKSQTTGLMKNDGSVDTSTYLTATDITGKEDSSNKVSSWSNSTTDDHYPSEKLVKDSLDDKISKSQTVGLVKNDGTIDTTTYLSEHQSLTDIGGVVAVVEKSSANSGAFKTYQITQGGTACAVEIDIPKDFLVKSGSVKTAGATPTTAESDAGVGAGEKYISLIINTKDSSTSSGNTELIIPAAGLVEDTLYYADESTVTAYIDSNDSNKNKFKVKAGGITTTELASGVVTSLGYADDYHSSPAASIETTDINAWNAKSELTTSDIETKVEEYLTSITNSLNS